MIWLLTLTIVVALVNWWAVSKGNLKLVFITKGAVMVLLMAWVWFAADFSSLKGPSVFSLRWFIAGMFFCLLGDVFLALPKDRFIAGLVAFLVGHLAYISAFRVFPMRWEYWVPSAVLVLLLGALWLRIIRRLAEGLTASGQQAMKLPVGLYSFVISVMVFAAYHSFIAARWGVLEAYLVASGATFFFVSDLLLAWDRFVEPIDKARLKVIVTYHLAQILLAIGFVLNFGTS